ncbi:mercury resistance system transport protein MerF [Vibrio sp. VB16]|uniref:mercury resistance system transport protein MerF n=1 Tax=Vibrio sp. VB16 TaxID=2785746 RepID=UPI00189E7723|nr:mercury resistance system transport protein MerF [Vibrio sp. VB16]UGA53807.1 mercury resistance system transport protein MerF [Vibrio sp. VB16]
MNKQRSLLKWSITGTVVATLCCFTPILVILFTAIGLSGLIGYLDYVLLPSLLFFVGLTTYALFKNKKKNESECD